tara:strand:+ start:1445 stop:1585 length:141 start_codon:yes stop_codon:yes gene_type:complete
MTDRGDDGGGGGGGDGGMLVFLIHPSLVISFDGCRCDYMLVLSFVD